MRLTGGEMRGRRLVSPRGAGIRPTSDRVRESLFSILGPLAGNRVLDLFSGAGTLGLEALSRGAEHVWFVDVNANALKALNESVAGLGVQARVSILRHKAPDVVSLFGRRKLTFELVFLDPPYGSVDLEPTLVALGELAIVVCPGIVVAEHDREAVLAERYGPLEKIDQRRYGRTLLSFYQHRESEL